MPCTGADCGPLLFSFFLFDICLVSLRIPFDFKKIALTDKFR